MFEKYTEKARRVIFFARYEASQFGQPHIETEHLLLGLLREDKALTNRFLRSNYSSVEAIRRQIEGHTTIRESISTSVDLPISNECKRVLAYAAEEAERLGHKYVGTEHVLLGLLREEKCFAAEILKERGVRLLMIREELAKGPHQPPARGPESAPSRTCLGTSCKRRRTVSSSPWWAAVLNWKASSRFSAAATTRTLFLSASPVPVRTQLWRVWRSASQRERFHHYWQTSGSWPSSRDLSPAGR